MQLTGGIAPELASDLTFTVFVSSISSQRMGDGEAIKSGYYNSVIDLFKFFPVFEAIPRTLREASPISTRSRFSDCYGGNHGRPSQQPAVSTVELKSYG